MKNSNLDLQYHTEELQEEHLTRMFDRDADFLDEVVNAFKLTADQCLYTLRKSLSTKDLSQFTKTCHKLKGSTRNFGNFKISQSLEQMERFSSEQELSELSSAQIEKLEVSIGKLIEDLRSRSNQWRQLTPLG